MNTAKLRSKRVIVSTVALIAALGIGGGVWASVASADVGRADRDRAGTAAIQAAGNGTVLDVEAGDDDGAAFEVEVRKDDGTEVDVTLDENFTVLTQETDTPDGASGGAAPGTAPGAADADDRALTDAERTSAEQAALTAIPGGTVLDVEPADRAGAAYEIDVRDAAGTNWDVDLDAAFTVLTKTEDK